MVARHRAPATLLSTAVSAHLSFFCRNSSTRYSVSRGFMAASSYASALWGIQQLFYCPAHNSRSVLLAEKARSLHQVQPHDQLRKTLQLNFKFGVSCVYRDNCRGCCAAAVIWVSKRTERARAAVNHDPSSIEQHAQQHLGLRVMGRFLPAFLPAWHQQQCISGHYKYCMPEHSTSFVQQLQWL